MSVPELTTFIVYLVGMLVIGSFFYRRTGNLSDYILGGRKLGSGVAALSAGASDMSGWLLLGLPGAIYASGMNQAWIGIGLTIGAYLNWQFVAKRLRRYTEEANDSLTLSDYLEYRFSDHTHLLRIISAIVILIFFTIYTSSGLVGGAILFKNSFGLNYTTALWSGAIVIMAYTFLGGFMAVSWTDFIQGILMFCALLIVPLLTINATGGWEESITTATSIDPKYNDIYSNMTFISIISLMAWGLGYFGQPHILARFMAIKSEKQVPKARLIGITWMILALYGAIFVGFLGISYFQANPLENSETVFISLTQEMFNPWVSGMLLAAILSAIMSTVDSQLLVCSSALTEDFYKKLFRKNAGDKELVWIGRVAVILVAIIALWIASYPESKVLDLVAYAWAGFGGAFGPVVLFSLFWGKMTRNGALGGIIGGALTVIIWKQLEGGIFDIYEILPGFIIGAVAVVAFSLLTGNDRSSKLFLSNN